MQIDLQTSMLIYTILYEWKEKKGIKNDIILQINLRTYKINIYFTKNLLYWLRFESGPKVSLVQLLSQFWTQ